MRAPRIFCVWTALGLCAVTVFGAMTWLTRNVLAAERERAAAWHERAQAEARADLEERTRLALWRMDALGASVVLRENLHPVVHYELLTQSPFLTTNDPEVFLHFKIQQGGGLTSPEFDEHNAKEAGVDAKIIQERKDWMKQLRALLAANPLPGDEWTQLNCAAVHGETTWNALPKDAKKEQELNKLLRETKGGDELRQDASYQVYSNSSEYAQRAKVVSKNIDAAKGQREQQEIQLQKPSVSLSKDKGAEPPPSQTLIIPPPLGEVADVSPMRGVWLGGELFLLRQVSRRSTGITKAVQGVWFNSGELRKQLLAEVADLLPQAALTPVVENDVAKDPLTLVSFPFRLVRNENAIAPQIAEDVKFGAPLLVGWIAVLLAVLATSLLVRGVMRLSERRASFVSAVTHELRTPLTTFRLYSDMLETGAVKEEKRGHYLRVLSREADRLSHLVENVLAFSRIERGNARSNVRDVETEELLEGMRERFESRLATAGLALEMDIPPGFRVRADIAAVEHILFNLIDNAAKYATAGDPPVVCIRAKEAGRFVELIVSDHGPGIAASERRRIFHAFHKSAREAAETQPGVGLGLALSRRLARAMGGDLKCAAGALGACFILSLPSRPPD
jgi:signal transduction histidine kinase